MELIVAFATCEIVWYFNMYKIDLGSFWQKNPTVPDAWKEKQYTNQILTESS